MRQIISGRRLTNGELTEKYRQWYEAVLFQIISYFEIVGNSFTAHLEKAGWDVELINFLSSNDNPLRGSLGQKEFVAHLLSAKRAIDHNYCLCETIDYWDKEICSENYQWSLKTQMRSVESSLEAVLDELRAQNSDISSPSEMTTKVGVLTPASTEEEHDLSPEKRELEIWEETLLSEERDLRFEERALARDRSAF